MDDTMMQDTPDLLDDMAEAALNSDRDNTVPDDPPVPATDPAPDADVDVELTPEEIGAAFETPDIEGNSTVQALQQQVEAMQQMMQQMMQQQAAPPPTPQQQAQGAGIKITDDMYRKAMASPEGFTQVMGDMLNSVHGQYAQAQDQAMANQMQFIEQQVVLRDWARQNPDIDPENEAVMKHARYLNAKFPEKSFEERLELLSANYRAAVDTAKRAKASTHTMRVAGNKVAAGQARRGAAGDDNPMAAEAARLNAYLMEAD